MPSVLTGSGRSVSSMGMAGSTIRHSSPTLALSSTRNLSKSLRKTELVLPIHSLLRSLSPQSTMTASTLPPWSASLCAADPRVWGWGGGVDEWTASSTAAKTLLWIVLTSPPSTPSALHCTSTRRSSARRPQIASGMTGASLHPMPTTNESPMITMRFIFCSLLSPLLQRQMLPHPAGLDCQPWFEATVASPRLASPSRGRSAPSRLSLIRRTRPLTHGGTLPPSRSLSSTHLSTPEWMCLRGGGSG
mmetsp:Transcript_23527/g.59524  ORF Transcript_23527/g.59524 Transcript_23527/m.59524 type:complete len:247 (-) Transcript_23527:328-1068(-)